jgi:hypothetical protein
MSTTGKSSISLKKADLLNQKNPAMSVRKLVFAHKAAAGESGINLSALTTPVEYSSKGFVQPSYEELQRANLLFHRKNLRLISTARGQLVDYDSYEVSSNLQINFTDSFGTSQADEIFIGFIEPVVTTGNLVADVEFILQTGTITAGEADVNVGKSFVTNLNPNHQMGAVMFIIDGAVKRRNVGNATAAPSAPGDYEEVDNGGGNCTLLRLNNTSGSDQDYIVVSTATTVVRPDGSVLDEIEKQQGTIDKLVETTASLAGVPEGNFQVTPTQPQLKQFGDRLVGTEQATLEDPTDASQGLKIGTAAVAGAFKKNLYQVKYLSANVTTDIVMSDLTYTLEVGKRYRLFLRSEAIGITADPGVSILVKDGGTTIGAVVHTADQAVGRATNSSWELIHVMTATSLTFTTSSASALSYITGTGDATQTYVMVEELNNYDVTSGW